MYVWSASGGEVMLVSYVHSRRQSSLLYDISTQKVIKFIMYYMYIILVFSSFIQPFLALEEAAIILGSMVYCQSHQTDMPSSFHCFLLHRNAAITKVFKSLSYIYIEYVYTSVAFYQVHCNRVFKKEANEFHNHIRVSHISFNQVPEGPSCQLLRQAQLKVFRTFMRLWPASIMSVYGQRRRIDLSEGHDLNFPIS